METLNMPPLFGKEITTGPDILEYMDDVASADLYGITCGGKEDGGGAQTIAAMSVQLFCKLTNQRYIHTPFRRVRFAEGKVDWAEKWEGFSSLGEEEERAPEGIRVLSTPQYLLEGRPKGVILAMPHCHNYIQNKHSPEAYELIRSDLRRKYVTNKNPDLDSLISDESYMAVHIRRGDVSSDFNNGRYTSNEAVIETIKKFSAEIDFKGSIHLFSQGNEIDFHFLNCIENVRLFVNTDIFETMHRMIGAKAIICAKSAVSYVSGLLSDAPVMSDLWYHQPLDSWYRMSETNLPAQHGFLKRLKTQEAAVMEWLSENTEEANDTIIKLVRSDARFLQFSAKMKWALSLVLLRRRDDAAYQLLEELASSNCPQSNSAQKLLASHIKMGLYYRPS
jgi:hypothetical protein